MQTTRAVVLRTVRYDDNRVVASLFTEDYGMISALIRVGNTRKKGGRSANVQILSFLEAELEYKAHADFQRIGEMHIYLPWMDLPYHPVKASIVMFLGNFLYHALRSEGSNANLFSFMEYSFQWLDEADGGYSNFHLIFMIRVTRFLGVWPGLDGYSRRGIYDLIAAGFTESLPSHGQYVGVGEAALIPLLLRMDYVSMNRIRLRRNERWHMLEIIVRYYQLHVPGFGELQNLDILREMFS